MKIIKKGAALLLALAVVLAVTGCGKEKTSGNTYEVNENPQSGNMGLSAMDGLDFNIETYEVKENKIDFGSIGQMELDLFDNITTYEAENIEDFSQEKLEIAIEKKENLLADLKNELAKQGIQVTVDETNGDIALDSSILFGVEQSEVSKEGKDFLAKFLPVYTSVIFGEKYAGFISQIIIEGHTDTDGAYDYNMKLSQDRADKVKAFCVSDASGISEQYQDMFNSAVESKGYSYDRPIKDANGNVDKAASRRVSFRFLIHLD